MWLDCAKIDYGNFYKRQIGFLGNYYCFWFAFEFCASAMKFRFFNARPIILILISLVVGIMLTNYFYTSKTIFVAILLVFLGVVVFYSIYYKKLRICIVMFLTALIGSLSLQIFIFNFYKTDNVAVGDEIECVVVQKRDKYENRFLVKEITDNGTKYDFNAYVNCTINDDLHFNEGNVIKFTVNSIYEYGLTREGTDIISTDVVGGRVKYSFSTDKIEKLSSKTSVRYNIKSRIKTLLNNALSNENVELMYSALLGDKAEINKGLYSKYQMSGVAHILAVSGLHVGLIVLIMKKILQSVKANKYVILTTIVAFLFGYAYICNWSYSVVRASIMAVVVILAPIFFREYDFLSAIGFAGTIILLITPFALFDISFVLSFMSVLGICLVYPIIHKFLKRHKKCNWFAESLGISIATNLAILVPSVYYFQSFNPIGILANILVLPLFGFIFTATFVVLIISLVVPFASYILYLINPVVNLLNLTTSIISSYDFSIVANKIKFLSIVACAMVLFFASKYNIKKSTAKAVSVVCALSIFALQLGVGFIV